MKIGFTGTRRGTTKAQRQELFSIIYRWNPDEFHHGDCLGADAEAHAIVRDAAEQRGRAIKIVGHLPDNEKLRAYCKFDERRDPAGYIERDHNIVDEVNLMVATPGDFVEVVRSGTWATVRYARKIKRHIIIIRPDGSFVEETNV